MKTLILLSLLFLQSPDDVVVRAQTTVPAYNLVEIDIVGKDIQKTVWNIIYTSDLNYNVGYKQLNPVGSSIVFTGPPGIYRVWGCALSNNNLLSGVTLVTIKESAPNPNPVPPPNPTPPPSPPPSPPSPPTVAFSTPFWVICIFDPDTLINLPPKQRAIWGSLTLASEIKKLGGTVRNYDVDSGDIANTKWLELAKKSKLPIYIVLNQHGGIIYHDSPVDEQSIVDQVRKLKGVSP